MKIRIKRNAVLCVLWVVFVLSLPIYVFWAVFNYEHLYSWTEKFCGLLDKIKYLYKNDGNNERRNDDATARVAGFADVVVQH